MIRNKDGTWSVEKGEAISIRREVDWVVQEWLDEQRYVGVLLFPYYGGITDYALFPYDDRTLRHDSMG